MNSSSKDAKKIYPIAVSLIKAISTYNQTLKKINSITGIATLTQEDLVDHLAQDSLWQGARFWSLQAWKLVRDLANK
ncbi:hypothetical protein PPACK8108_LOCUS11599, partial [Phakopsora pachyrhizi]